MTKWLLVLAAAAAALSAPALRAETYPTRPITLVAVFGAGSASDTICRVLAEPLGAALKQPVIVEDRPGADGALAATYVARANPDGYTLMLATNSPLSADPFLLKDLSYDAIKDFTPIGMIGATPNVLAVNASVPATTVGEFIRYVKANLGKVSYGSAGAGSLTHLTMELFKQETGTIMVHIPYRGIAPAINDLLGGQTQAMFPGLAAALPHLRSGRVRALAVTGHARSPQLKDIPTLEESGFKGFDAMQWYGSVGPAGIADDVVRRLNETQVAVLRDPELRERLSVEAVEPLPMTPEQFGQFIRADIQRWTALAKARNIRLDE